MTVSIIASGPVRREVQGRPHPRRVAVWMPFESIVWAVSLLCAVRRVGGSRGGHRRVAAGTRVTSSSARGPVRRFVKEFWPLLAVLGFFALVTVVGVLVLSVQVPR